MNEKELVIKAKKGDINAFCLLYDMYKKKLYNYAYYKLGNSADAEDVVQDCVLTAFEQIHKLKNPEAFSSWLFRILYCGCSANIKTQISNKSNADISNYENSISYDNNLEFEREELKQALNILKTDERNIVLLSVVAGFNSKAYYITHCLFRRRKIQRNFMASQTYYRLLECRSRYSKTIRTLWYF